MKQNPLVCLSTKQIILAYFLFHYVSAMLNFVWSWSKNLGLIVTFPSSLEAQSITYNFRIYYVYTIIPSLLLLYVAQKEWNLKYPPFPSHGFFMGLVIGFAIYLFISIMFVGLGVNFPFLSSNIADNLTLLVYCGIATFIGYIFRHQGTVEAVLFASLGVVAISGLWELPCMHLLGQLSQYLPLFLWFFLFRNVYIKLIRRCIHICRCYLEPKRAYH